MTEVRRCWAFHRDGARCEHPAGHPGNHVVSKEWTDAECATPGEPVQNLVRVPIAPQEPPTQAPPTKCVACQHHHKGGACKCGCHEFIG